MPLTINTNMAASRASYYLSKNNDMLQKSLDRLSSGKKITEPADDAGGLAVSMKMKGSIDRLKGAANNIANGISFLQVQDGILNSAAQIVSRMAELKGLYSDVLKSTTDKATYDSEFSDLQSQLFQLSQSKFNGVSLYGYAKDGGNALVFGTAADEDYSGGPSDDKNASIKVYTTEEGSSGSSIGIRKSLLLSALTFTTTVANGITTATASAGWADDNTRNDTTRAATAPLNAAVITLAVDAGTKLQLGDVDTFTFTQALENMATLRASNGGSVKRLQYAQDSINSQMTNLEAANGRIMDVDVAKESTNLARHQVLVQASAAMVAQAKLSTNVALTLLQ